MRERKTLGIVVFNRDSYSVIGSGRNEEMGNLDEMED